MTPPAKSSSRRRQEEKKDAEDVFVEKTLEFVAWAKDNTQILVLVGVAIVVLVAGTLYYRNYRVSMEDRAVAQLERVQASVGAGEREAAKAQLYQYLNDFDGTTYALEARLILGQVLLEDGQPQEAIDALAPAVRAMDEEPIGVQAAFLLAAAYEDSGQTEEAERMFMRISGAAELGFQIREALAGAARLRANDGDYAGAVRLYSDVLATLEENSPERSYWEMRMAEAEARAGT